MALPDGPVLRARRAAALQGRSYLAAGALSILAAALVAHAELSDWVGLGLISPLIIAAALSVFGRPGRRVVGAPAAFPPQVRAATEAETARLPRAIFALLVGIAGFLAILGSHHLLVIAAVGLAHTLALALLHRRLTRLERRLGAPLYQSLGAGIWREPLYAWTDPGAGDPAALTALGRRPGRDG